MQNEKCRFSTVKQNHTANTVVLKNLLAQKLNLSQIIKCEGHRK